MKCIFGVELDIKVFYKLMILGVDSQACQKYSKKEICVSLQYLQKDMGSEVGFLPTDKDQCFL